MAATYTVTAPSPAEAWLGYTIAIAGLANNTTAYVCIVTDPSGAVSNIPFTSTGGGGSGNLTYVPTCPGTLTLNVQLAKVPVSEGTGTTVIPAFN